MWFFYTFTLHFRGVAQSGSVHVWGAWGREFESRHPDKLEVESVGSTFFYSNQLAGSLRNSGATPISWKFKSSHPDKLEVETFNSIFNF